MVAYLVAYLAVASLEASQEAVLETLVACLAASPKLEAQQPLVASELLQDRQHPAQALPSLQVLS